MMMLSVQGGIMRPPDSYSEGGGGGGGGLWQANDRTCSDRCRIIEYFRK